MKLPARQRSPIAPPGLVGTARVERRTRSLLPRLRPGDLAVLDHLDMDRATAQALVDAGVAAVVNASPMISGRYANLGPQVLADAGVLLVDRIGAEGLAAIKDGTSVRVHEATVYVDDEPVRVRPRARRRRRPRRDGAGPHRSGHPAARRSPTTAPSSCAARRTSSCTAAACRARPPGSPAGRSSWWSPGTSTPTS